MRDILVYFATKYFGNWDKIYNALDSKEEVDWANVKLANENAGQNIITILDENYPVELKKIVRPPFVLFYKGNSKLLKTKDIIWVYGSYVNENFIDLFKSINDEMVENKITRVIGCSDSYENYSLNSDMSQKNLIVVKDCGIDSQLILSKELEDKVLSSNGLIITEYPLSVVPSLKTWDDSNRIKCGLAKGLFLINSLKEKTTFRIIRETLEEGKEVYALNIYTDNLTHNSMLISKGAYPIKKISELTK